MFNKKNDPLTDAVKKVMEQSERERQAVLDTNKKFGVYSRNALPHEKLHEYDATLKKTLTEDTQEPLEESSERLDEVSKKILRKYIAHAARSMANYGEKKKSAAIMRRDSTNKSTDKTAETKKHNAQHKIDVRGDSIVLAAKKLSATKGVKKPGRRTPNVKVPGTGK